MFTRAIVCTDLSSSSDGIVRCAEQLGLLGVCDVVLAHVIDIDRPGAVPGAGSDALFQRQLEELERAGIEVRIDTAVGYAPYEIERIASEHDAGLIVAGSHGKGLFDGVMSGSVSSDLVRIAERPVLLTAPATSDDPDTVGAACASMLANILVPIDFSGSCDHAVRLAMDMAEKGARAITLLHVVQRNNGTEYSHDESSAQLERVAERAADAGVADVRVKILVGDPERIVSEASASGEYSLIVMGPHCGHGSNASLDSVTDAVLQKTVVPVLLAPPGWNP